MGLSRARGKSASSGPKLRAEKSLRAAAVRRGGDHGAREVRVRPRGRVLDGRVAAERAVSGDAERAGQHRARPGGQGGPACPDLPGRARARRPPAGAPGQLRARAHRSAAGRDDRSGEAPGHRRRSARRTRSRNRRHEARERNRRGAARRPCGLFHRLPAETDAGADDRGRLPGRGDLHRGRSQRAIRRRRASRSSSPIARPAGRS